MTARWLAPLSGIGAVVLIVVSTIAAGSQPKASALLGAGAAVLGTNRLPRQLGWAALVLGVVGAVPSHVIGGLLDHIGFVAFVGLLVWIVAVSLALRREGTPVAVPAEVGL